MRNADGTTSPEIRIGTSGWVYRDWRGSVYPEGLAQRSWLEHLSRRFPTIEINASFYRLPARSTFEGWASQVPDGFRFAVKMSRFLTHVRRFRDPAEPIELFWERASGLGPACGPVLFQQPPTFAKDLGLLRDLLQTLPDGMRAAFEFRHRSWHDDEVLSLLDAAGAAWVLADSPGARVPLHVTGGWSYVRFHRGTRLGFPYTAEKLRRWSHAIGSLDAREVFAYFNNDPGGAAVRDAERLRRLLSRPGTRRPRRP
jgi:uncharacterized protein YecE (DUF72 family)